jgi:pyruvate,water dikinase
MPEAELFLRQLDELLLSCGHREQRLDIVFPTWGEDPAPVIGYVRSYLKLGPAANPAQRELELIKQREVDTGTALETLSGSMADKLLRLPLFRYLLEQAQWLLRERDTMHFEWTRLFPGARRMQLEIGRRWQRRNLLDDAEDIFFLELEEQDAIAGSPKPCQDLIRRRREEYQENLAGPWPTRIKDGKAALEKPKLKPAAAGAEAGILTGIAGSPGVVAGPVRVIAGLEDFPKLKPGDILVAPMTNPVWTPLFAVAGGIVTEVGGVLSHGAIVAREYGIPAVMSVPDVTTILVNGDIVEVDGDNGLVLRRKTEEHATHTIAQNHTPTAHQSIPFSLD